jgi:hypothetical protein
MRAEGLYYGIKTRGHGVWVPAFAGTTIERAVAVHVRSLL